MTEIDASYEVRIDTRVTDQKCICPGEPRSPAGRDYTIAYVYVLLFCVLNDRPDLGKGPGGPLSLIHI